MDVEEIGTLVGSAGVGAILSFIVQRAVASYSAGRREKTDEISGIIEELSVLRQEIFNLKLDSAVLKQEVVPLSLAVQQWAVAKLTHNHTPEMDELMTRIGSLDEPEMVRLGELLRDRVVEYDDPEIDAIERLAAAMLLHIMNWVKEAEKYPSAPSLLRLVSKPPAPDDAPKGGSPDRENGIPG